MTRRLFERRAWARARSILREPQVRVLVAMDLDGTLAPIARRPELARVPAATLRAIERAARSRNARVAILSARPFADLKRLVPVRNMLLVGQYGLEGPLRPTRSVTGSIRRRCALLTRALRPVARSAPGALLEPKGLTVAVHDRGVRDPRARRRLCGRLHAIASGEAARLRFEPMPGARVTDFVPRGRDKGRALRALRARLRPAVVFCFGDSGGDEPAFASLGKDDFPVRVGAGATRARYRVAGIEDVARFLDAVAAARAGTANL